MRRILSGETGLAAVVLVMVIAWALVAVLLLTGTLLAARNIDKDVGIIRPELSNIGRNIDMIKLATTTERVSAQISKAAVPLTGQLDQTLSSVHGIDAHAKSILGRVGAINQTAGSINSTVHAINSTAHAINGNVHAIDANVNSIDANVLAINANARGINANARAISGNALSINSSVNGIHGNATLILGTVGSIRAGVVGINNRADAVIAVARAIRGDLDAVLAGVGTTNTGGTIAGHANSIDCSALLNLLGPTPSCNK